MGVAPETPQAETLPQLKELLELKETPPLTPEQIELVHSKLPRAPAELLNPGTWVANPSYAGAYRAPEKPAASAEEEEEEADEEGDYSLGALMGAEFSDDDEGEDGDFMPDASDEAKLEADAALESAMNAAEGGGGGGGGSAEENPAKKARVD